MAQLGVRRLLATERNQMLDALSQRFEAASIDLRKRANERDVDGIDDSVKVLEALEIEQKGAEEGVPLALAARDGALSRDGAVSAAGAVADPVHHREQDGPVRELS